MAAPAKLGIVQDVQPARLEPADLLTPQELATRLKVPKSWVFRANPRPRQDPEQKPLPVHSAWQVPAFQLGCRVCMDERK